MKEIYLMARQTMKDLMSDIVNPKVESNRKVATFLLILISVSIAALALYGAFRAMADAWKAVGARVKKIILRKA